MQTIILNTNVMQKKQTILESLQERVKSQKEMVLKFSKSNFYKNISSSIYDNVLIIINEMKDAEKEQSRLDWKAGYNECVLDMSEAFGNKRNGSFPNKKETEVIDKLSFDYINKKNK